MRPLKKFVAAPNVSHRKKMFTGLVETAAQVSAIEERGDGARLTLDHAGRLPGLEPGESVACNGVCLTVASTRDNTADFDVLRQTLSVTNLGSLRRGCLVNCERALRAGDRLGGHFVTGHVDRTAPVLTWEQRGADWLLEVAIAPEERHLVVPKGCVAIDGISLTIAEVLPDRMRFWIIPHTRAVTNLATRTVGALVNIEFDLLGKYVAANLLTAPHLPVTTQSAS